MCESEGKCLACCNVGCRAPDPAVRALDDRIAAAQRRSRGQGDEPGPGVGNVVAGAIEARGHAPEGEVGKCQHLLVVTVDFPYRARERRAGPDAGQPRSLPVEPAGHAPAGTRAQLGDDRKLLERLELKGALVTIDAMGCQTKIAAAILDRGADYLLAVKDNQPALNDDIKSYFDHAPPEELQTFQTTDADHGRIEVRRHVVSHNVNWLAEDSRFPGIKSIAMVENTVERNGETSCERRYYICSLLLLVVLFANAVRCHWHIENRLHWVLR